jgi:ATP-dependent Clp protease ATP-binding subunit ClpC
MEKINYPLLYFRLNEDSLLGMLVGTQYKLVGKDEQSIRSSMSDYLQRMYRKQERYPYFAITKPRMKVYKVSVRPSYRDNAGSYPLSHKLEIPVYAVYGETPHNYYDCFLPLFDQHFYYYDPKQLKSLVEHFAHNHLNQLQPEDLYSFLQYPEPAMDLVTLKVKPFAGRNQYNFQFKRSFPTLEKLAEKLPHSKGIRKNISTYPEAAWELEEQVEQVFDKIINTRSNVLIVGSHGVGKSAVLQQVVKRASSKRLQLDFTFWRIMPQRITAAAKYLGDWQETCEELVNELQAANGMLWVVDLVRMLQTGGSGPEDSVAAFLTSFIQQGKLQLMGEATPQEVESMRRLLPGFVENFQIVKIEELPEKKVQRILQLFADYAAQNLRMPIDSEALQLAYRLLLRYYPYESFPGKGIKFLGQCVSEAQSNEAEKVDKQAIIQQFTKQTGLPELFLRDELLLDQEKLEHFFSSQIIGQPAAIQKLCGIVKIYKAGLNNPYKPINTLIFAGPTGVGKTASAKALADYFFGISQTKSPLIRIDMSEFQHAGQLSRLIGSGREVGQLVREVRERPFAVILLDEVEKASPIIFDALLSVLDEGMLVDAFGRMTNFRNTIIIMTTNLGASNRKSIGFEQTTSEEDAYMSAIKRHFRPEFVNRIDGVVHFNALQQEDIKQIALKELEELKQREGLVKQRLDVVFTDKVVQYLVKTGFDERYGARPLQRRMTQDIMVPISNWLIENPGIKDTTLKIDYQKGVVISLAS